MDLVSVVVLVATTLSIVFFLTYVAGLFQLPSRGRPKTPEYDRYGRQIGETENPSFQETEEERERR